MKLAFRRRKVRVVDAGSGATFECKIPFDPGARDDQDAWLRFTRRLAELNPDQISALLDSRLGSILFGSLVPERSPIDNYPSTPEGYIRYLREQRPELTRRGRG